MRVEIEVPESGSEMGLLVTVRVYQGMDDPFTDPSFNWILNWMFLQKLRIQPEIQLELHTSSVLRSHVPLPVDELNFVQNVCKKVQKAPFYALFSSFLHMQRIEFWIEFFWIEYSIQLQAY